MSLTGPELLLDLDLEGGEGGRRDRLESALRAAIREGRLRPGDRLPATRALASELGCSRWVVVEAYEQLAAEGWIEGRAGSGTRVRAERPLSDAPLQPPAPARPRAPTYAFTVGLPDLVSFPRTAWLRAMQRAVRQAPAGELGHADPRGARELRWELAA